MENNNRTAMQKLIDIINQYCIESSDDIRFEDECITLGEVKKDALLLLVEEKNQIKNAVQWAVDMINEQEEAIAKDVEGFEPSHHELSSEDYYNLTYKQ